MCFRKRVTTLETNERMRASNVRHAKKDEIQMEAENNITLVFASE